MADFNNLRRRAENEIKRISSAGLEDLSVQDKDQLIEELRIHQVELEIQNQQLRWAQQQLEVSREQYIALYDAAPVGYFTLNPSGLILAANLTGAAQLGRARPALLNQRFANYVVQADRDIFYLHLRRCTTSQTGHTCELQLITRDKSPFEAHLESTPVVDERWGSPQIRTAVIDITAQKQMGAELEEHRYHLERLVAARTTELNQVNKRLQAEICERTRTEAILEESKNRLEQTLAELNVAQEQVVRQERLAAVGQLAAGIAHDFNNILTAIIGYAEILDLRAENLSSTDRKHINIIIKQGERAAHLIRQILDFSRKSIRQPRSLDLGDFLQNTHIFLQRIIPETIRLRLQIGSDPFLIEADPTQLQQLLTNLAVNARDVMPEGGLIEFRLSSFSLEVGEPPPCPYLPPGKWVCLAVSDTGRGIPTEILPRIFEPFFTTKDVGQGTGLGLAQVYGIVKQHEGFIDVESQVGAGTTFTVYFPSSPVTTTRSVPLIVPKLPQGQGGVVLVVEDEPVVLEVVTTLLESLNYQVLSAVNGQEALRIYRANQARIAVVLTDLVMPELDGVGLLRALQAEYPAVKVIFMSGYPKREPVVEMLAHADIGWVQKPPGLMSLAEALHRALH